MRALAAGVLLLSGVAAVQPPLARGVSLVGTDSLWDEAANAVALPAAWPPTYVAMPPVFVPGEGFTLAARVWVTSSGPVWAMGTSGDPAQPNDWASSHADYLRVDVSLTGASLSWAARPQGGGAGPFTVTCPRTAPPGAWVFIAVSVSETAAGATAWTIAQSDQVCSGTTAVPLPVGWWPLVAVGGGTFSGWVADAAAYDTAMTAAELGALAAGNTSACPPTQAEVAWDSGALGPGLIAWASSLAPSGCVNATGGAVPCSANAVINSWPSSGGCDTNAVLTAGGVDAYPSITVDLGARSMVNTVRLYEATMAANPYVSYAILVGDVQPPGPGANCSLKPT